jgi:hypothetical protein
VSFPLQKGDFANRRMLRAPPARHPHRKANLRVEDLWSRVRRRNRAWSRNFEGVVISDHQFACFSLPSAASVIGRSCWTSWRRTFIRPRLNTRPKCASRSTLIITRRSLRNSNMQRANVIYGICFTPTHKGPWVAQSGVRSARGDHGEKSMAGTRSVQLQCPRYPEHGSAHSFWFRRTQQAMAEDVAGGHDPLGVRDDRAAAP